MTDIVTHSTTAHSTSAHSTSGPASTATTALQGVTTAGELLAAAKRSQSPNRIDRAERRLQVAVDAARDQRIEWGRIGSALGIARGNAYQRYRKRADQGRYPSH